MAAINDLINQIDDLELRERIKTEVDKLSKQKKFGLVFEDHVPECTALYDVPVHVGSKVALKDKKINDVYVVKSINDDQATCVNTQTKETTEFSLDSLVSIAEFGEAIYPYLQPIDNIENAPNSSLWHTLIEADNYHALQLLEYLYAGKVDCIYIDPPYNTGAKDWKYNNDYVDSSDAYRHSKWLSMMEKRLKLVKKLLTATGVLIVAIDDYEYAHLCTLIEGIMSDYDISPVVVLHHPQGGAADNISRVHEYAIFVTPKGHKAVKGCINKNVYESWSLMRGGTDIRNKRLGRPNSFYAIYVNKKNLDVVGVGPQLSANDTYDINLAPDGCVALYPIGKDGTERVWRYERLSMQEKIKNNLICCSSKMSLSVIKKRETKYDPIFSVWSDNRFNAGTQGTNLVYKIFDKNNRFSYPKSLYTVKDCVKSIVQENKSALILDFFAGSGTTLHAVNLLNAEDGGRRRCIMVTNNEVSDEEAKKLKKDGFKPGDPEWERLGIAHYVTWPRTVCSIKGEDINGNPLKGTYLDSERAMADGFKANAAFFKLGFLDKNAVALGRQFKELLPVLWMKTGCVGLCPKIEEESLPSMLILPENAFAVLIDEHAFPEFTTKVNDEDRIKQVFIVTDSTSGYREMISHLSIKKSYQLYRDYLDNFRINTGR